jgi:DNA transformation protein and related proteins
MRAALKLSLIQFHSLRQFRMPVSPAYLQYVIDQFAPFAKIATRRMFSGIGLYWDEAFIGLIDDDVLFLKVDDSNRDEYIARGCRAFQPTPDLTSMNYYQLPEDVLEDSDELKHWARKSHAIAAQQALAKAKKKASKGRTSRR